MPSYSPLPTSAAPKASGSSPQSFDKTSFRSVATFALATLAWLAANIASAQPVVDQMQLEAGEQRRAIHSATPLAQSFVVGADGYFAGVELSLQGPGSSIPLRIKLVDRDGTLLGSVPLGEVHKTAAALGAAPDQLDPASITATYVDFTGFAIPVTVGDTLALRLSTENTGVGDWTLQRSLSNTYPDGSFFTEDSLSLSVDMAFRTFVTDPIFADGFETGDLSRWHVVQDP